MGCFALMLGVGAVLLGLGCHCEKHGKSENYDNLPGKVIDLGGGTKVLLKKSDTFDEEQKAYDSVMFRD